MCILTKRFGVEIHVLQERDNNLLEILFETTAEFGLHDADNFIIMFHPENNVADSGYAFLVGLLLELTDDVNDVSYRGTQPAVPIH